jgi:hypothetical protein
MLQAVGLQPVHQFVRSAESGQMARVDDVGDDAQARARQPAHELKREKPVVTAGEHPVGTVGHAFRGQGSTNGVSDWRGSVWPALQVAGITGSGRVSAWIPVRDVRGWMEAGGRLRLNRRQDMPICRDFTGATGLEPATSGVTDRYRLDRNGRVPP